MEFYQLVSASKQTRRSNINVLEFVFWNLQLLKIDKSLFAVFINVNLYLIITENNYQCKIALIYFIYDKIGYIYMGFIYKIVLGRVH